MIAKIATNYSPNFTTPARNKKNIKYIVYHYTGMSSETKAINRLTDDRSKVSCHYFIKNNGSIILMVPEIYEAWHAGKSYWKKDNLLNKKSLGIEISNKGHQFGYQNFSRNQVRSILKLSKYLIAKYKIKKKYVLGHSDIAVDRKKDPGERFPWKYLSSNKVGFWHQISEKTLKKLRNKKISNFEEREFFKYLFKFGYSKKFNDRLNKRLLIKSFQRHFRQKLINGIPDQECFIISKNLLKS